MGPRFIHARQGLHHYIASLVFEMGLNYVTLGSFELTLQPRHALNILFLLLPTKELRLQARVDLFH